MRSRNSPEQVKSPDSVWNRGIFRENSAFFPFFQDAEEND
jgi:hypothetical protein